MGELKKLDRKGIKKKKKLKRERVKPQFKEGWIGKRWKFIFRPYIHLLFLRDWKGGILLLLTTFLLPNGAIVGLISLIATILFAEFIGMGKEYLEEGFYLYNSLLVGLGVGYYYSLTPTVVAIAIILSVFTFLVSYGIKQLFWKYRAPILSVPFSLVSVIFILATYRYITLSTSMLSREPIGEIVPEPGSLFYSLWNGLLPFFKGMGMVLFLPYGIAGLIISAIILFYSRILFLGAVGGFWTGVIIHSLFVGWETALHSSFNFNFILIGMGLAGVFLIPNWRSYLLALVGIGLGVVLADAMEVFFNQYHLPVFTIPFNLVIILMVTLLGTIGYPYFNYYPKETPERSLTYYLSFLFRFGGSGIKIGLPFTGTWQVYQGFDGEWTHKGIWRYAYDFIKTRDGKSYRGDGLRLEDYYSFGADVVAPISGYIYDARSDLPDREIGNPDRQNSWGNYVVIRGTDGTFVEISHLMQNSLKYPIGSYVEEGQVIAKCGNSGYSPEPHIHIQVQSTGAVGAATLPFKFREIIKGKRLYYYQLPKVGEEVTAPIRHPGLGLLLNFILDDLFEYTLYRNGEKVGNYSFWVEMEQKGEFYFTDGKNRLYFYLTPTLFYFYRYEGRESYLKLLFKTAPKIPIFTGQIKFEDYLPLNVRFNRFIWIMEFITSFSFKLFDKSLDFLSVNGNLTGPIGKVELNWESKGFRKIEGEGIRLELQQYRLRERNGSKN